MRAWLVLGIALASAPAFADDSSEPPATFHKGQFGLSARFGVGYRFLAPRNEAIYCGQTDATERDGYASVCTGRAPLAIGLEASYGVARHIELLFALDFGVEQDFGSTPAASNGARPLQLAAGARFFFAEATHSKLFVQPMAMLDATDQKTTMGSRGTEYGVRSLEGYWIDLHRAYGFYLYVGETVGMTPWLAGEIEGGFGIQGRYP